MGLLKIFISPEINTVTTEINSNGKFLQIYRLKNYRILLVQKNRDKNIRAVIPASLFAWQKKLENFKDYLYVFKLTYFLYF